MGITLGTNIASLRAQRQLIQTGDTLGTVFERLSSGQRINRASDDAAGLAIASSLEADTRVYTQALRNANDGISFLNIAEGALNSTKTVLTRLNELAIQSANGVYTSVQREALDQEADALVEEYNRIMASVEFNGVELYSSEFEELVLQIGYGTDGSLLVELGDEVKRAVGTGDLGSQITSTAAFGFYTYKTGDFNNDGNDDLVFSSPNFEEYVLLSNGDGTFEVTMENGISTNRDVVVGDFNNDGNVDYLAINDGADRVFVKLGNGDGTFRSALSSGATIQDNASDQYYAHGDLNNDGILDIAYRAQGGTHIYASLGNGDGTFGDSYTVYQNDISFDNFSDIKIADLNNDGNSEIIFTTRRNNEEVTILQGDGSGSFSLAAELDYDNTTEVSFGDVNDDGRIDIAIANQDGIFILENEGNFNFTEGYSHAGEEWAKLEDFNNDGYLDLMSHASSTESTLALGDGTGSFTIVQTVATGSNQDGAVGDFNGDGVLDFTRQVGGSLTTYIQNSENVASLQFLNLKTQQSALDSLGIIADARNRTSLELGLIGAAQSRLSISTSNLASIRLNSDGARSRIIDADIANESAGLVRANILQQAASAVLAQANQQPALALQLLG